MVKTTKVSKLPTDTLELVHCWIEAGQTSNWIASQLRLKGHSFNTRNIEHYRASYDTLPTGSPIEASASAIVPSLVEYGLTTDTRQIRLAGMTLDVLEQLYLSFKKTPDLRTARIINELSHTANNIIRARHERETLPPPVISIAINMETLEAEDSPI